jgi:hypothetical protein
MTRKLFIASSFFSLTGASRGNDRFMQSVGR